ncbi:MAG: LCP family protein [Caldilineaceae bacterium]
MTDSVAAADAKVLQPTAAPDQALAPVNGPTPPIGPRLAAPELRQKTISSFVPQLPDEATKTEGEKAVSPQKEEPAIGPAVNWANTENYLVLGTDRLPGQVVWRTDSIMMVGLDREKGRATVLSIPRDLWVQIPNYGWGRINQVDYLGEQRQPGNGPFFVSQVLSQTLGISAQHWVRVQMDGFQAMIDAVGGVTIHLDCPFYELSYSGASFALPAGDIHLDGATAYRYVRLRLRESDIGRASRQRQVLWALRNQAMQANLITRLPELWSAFQGAFSTDLGLLDLLSLARFGMSLDKSQVRAGGITLNDLQSFVTAQGADVLRIANPNRVRAVVDGVWEAPEMDNSRKQTTAKCPALPPGVKVTQVATDTVKAGGQ